MKLYIVSNRLPVKTVCEADGSFTFTRSEGGLATGLHSLETTDSKHWIGWPGICTDSLENQKQIASHLEKMDFHPVFLTEEQLANYYEGYSNSTIWPLCHYFFAYTSYKNRFWEAYKEVNNRFCEEVCQVAGPDDWVWVQDYQLMLLPNMLRKRMPRLHIGYFHHIPFPSYELFRILPERAELLRGLLGADFIAFHTHDYMRHFISATERVLHLDFNLDETQIDNRVIRVDALPMGINYDLYHQAINRPEVQLAIRKNQKQFGKHKLLLSVDRLDYSKGILHRLAGFSSFLEHHPEYRGKVTLAMVIVPSRDHIGRYADLKNRIDEEIGSINGRFSTMDWTPVCYFYHSFPLDELTAMYYLADVALVTPLRDGMNLVAKEYVAAKYNNKGVLILSEMAGAAAELTDAIQINPNDTSQIEQAIYDALCMPETEQKTRINRMQAHLSRQTVHKWAADFVKEWKACCFRNQCIQEQHINTAQIKEIQTKYAQANKRLILLDYDGTLAPLRNRPEDAMPTPALLSLLQKLSADPLNHIAINSGRDHETLEKWLGNLPISLAAEHGVFYKEHGVWHNNEPHIEWSAGLLSILKQFVAKTPRSHLEIKKTALAWHYRKTDTWLGSLRSQQLINALLPICQQQNLQIMQGKKVIEIKSPQYTKGSEVKRLLNNNNYDFILAMGDDTTDDDMFRALPEQAYSIKVGAISGEAHFCIVEQADVIPFLQQLSEKPTADEENQPIWKQNWHTLVDQLKHLISHDSITK